VPSKRILTIAEPSRLRASAMNAGQPAQFSLMGGRGLQYEIQSSTELTAWSPLATITITNLDGTAPIIDTNAPASDRKFYRAVLR